MYINKYNMGISNFEGFTRFGGSIIEGNINHDHDISYSMLDHTHNMDPYLKTSELLNNNKIMLNKLPNTYKSEVESVNAAKTAADTAATNAERAIIDLSNTRALYENEANGHIQKITGYETTGNNLVNGNDDTSITKLQSTANGLVNGNDDTSITKLQSTANGLVNTNNNSIKELQTEGDNLVNNNTKSITKLQSKAKKVVIDNSNSITNLHNEAETILKEMKAIKANVKQIEKDTNNTGQIAVSEVTASGAGTVVPNEEEPYANMQEGFIEGIDGTTQFLAGAYRKHEDNISKQAQERSLNRMGEFLQQSDDIAGQHFMDYLIHEKRGTVDDVFQRQKQDNILKERLVQTKEYQMRIYDQYIKIGKVAVIAFALCVFFMFLNSKEFIGDGSKFVSIFLIVIITIIYVIREIIWLSLRDPINFDKTNQGHDRQYEHDISNNKYSGKNYDLGILSGTCVGSSCCEAGQTYDSTKNKCISNPEGFATITDTIVENDTIT